MLVNGNIPAGEPCPFIDNICKGGMGDGRCPTKKKPFDCDYSCGMARGWNTCSKNKKVDDNG